MARPRIYSNAIDLDKKGNEYFDNLGTRKPTITGLVWHLGFESRQSFYDYESEDEFSYTIKRLRLRIELEYEQKLHEQACTGAIFALKNFGWKDKTEQEIKYPEGVQIVFEKAGSNDSK